jgi:hypothetical protein
MLLIICSEVKFYGLWHGESKDFSKCEVSCIQSLEIVLDCNGHQYAFPLFLPEVWLKVYTGVPLLSLNMLQNPFRHKAALPM